MLTAIQAIVSVSLIILILLQERQAGAGSLFGGVEGGLYQKRRGLEKGLFMATIMLLGIFGIVSLLNLVF